MDFPIELTRPYLSTNLEGILYLHKPYLSSPPKGIPCENGPYLKRPYLSWEFPLMSRIQNRPYSNRDAILWSLCSGSLALWMLLGSGLSWVPFMALSDLSRVSHSWDSFESTQFWPSCILITNTTYYYASCLVKVLGLDPRPPQSRSRASTGRGKRILLPHPVAAGYVRLSHWISSL